MSVLTLRLRQSISQRIDMSPFIPEQLMGKTAKEISQIPLWLGNRQVDSGELFDINGIASEQIVIQSESDRLDGIGAAMSSGTIRVEGNAGAYLGSGMRGGKLLVNGNVGTACGRAMRGGHLSIHGNAGDFLGGAYIGERQGMRGGIIQVQGNVGARAGDQMRRGTIIIQGDCGDYCASRMVAGTLVVLGQTGQQTGLGMRRGSVITTKKPATLPATFNDNGRHNLSFLSLLNKHHADLSQHGHQVQRWLGDLACDGKGEILVLC